ncbi:MAG: hypothetical protein FRX49_10603 [Trebouxia sp. A1-2]|nr:MAG: hypothetical protein FRX49_10603 [Trebouxia sp. A1-2]
MGKRKAQSESCEPSGKRSQKAEAFRCTRQSEEATSADQLRGVKRLQTVTATAQKLWREAVAARWPVIIEGELKDPEWRASSKWTNEYLQHRAGGSNVLVEQKLESSEGFGKGRKVHMTFGQLVQQLHKGNDSLYLTTQEAGVDGDGHPHVMGFPVKELKGDFPLRPECMGNLVPQQINLWMGAAPNGASSGLHHDFHDNLYILLRGRKRFRLYPPCEAGNMYTHGQVQHVHPNGRIIYKGQPMLSADGSDPGAVKQWQRQQAAESDLADAEEAGAKARLREAEQALEVVLDAQLGFRRESNASSEDDDASSFGLPANFKDDYIDSEAEASSSDGDSSPNRAAAVGSALQARGCQPDCKSSEANHDAGPDGINWEANIDDSSPPSFSRVDLAQAERDIWSQFPLFPAKDRGLECELKAGEMLYMPCGWFHEVRSYGNSKEGGHFALNYWFHPPDNLDTSLKGMQNPYRTNYWHAHWAGSSRNELCGRRLHYDNA